jgi:pentatricopeptide repeat protein
MLTFDLFEKMLKEGIQPDKIVLLSILTVCTHAGVVEAGTLLFVTMMKKYGVPQSIEHHNTMVDLLGRAGQVHEAMAMLNVMPIQPNLVSWVTLLGACRNQGNTELGRDVLRCALKLQGKHSGSLLLAMQMLGQEKYQMS